MAEERKTTKVEIHEPLQIGDKVYFPGEVEVPVAEAEGIKNRLQAQKVAEAEGGVYVPPEAVMAPTPAEGKPATSRGSNQGKSGGGES